MIEKILKACLTLVLCGCILVGGSYAYLKYIASNETSKAQSKKEDEPYSSADSNTPENCGILFKMSDGSGCLVYLNFESLKITVMPSLDAGNISDNYRGYEVDDVIGCDFEFISSIVDRIGGLNIQSGEEKIRLSGEQVVELMCENIDTETQKQLIMAVAVAIKENGISRSDIVYIIENCDTSGLTLAKCYYWSEYLGKMSDNINIII